MIGNIENHKKHLAVVSAEVFRKKMDYFRLKDVRPEVLPFICQPFIVKAPFAEYRKWLHPLDPISLDDLKNWFGVPNDAAKRMAHEPRVICEDGKLWAGATQVTPRALPTTKEWEFKRLNAEQRHAVLQMSRNLLYGYVTPDSQSMPVVQGVVKHMLASVKKLKPYIFVAPDLIVCPDTVVEFQNVPALYFNNILVYGNGQIKTKSTTTIHAVQIKHVP